VPDRDDRHGTGGFLHAINDQVGQAWQGEATQALSRWSTRPRMRGQAPERVCDIVLYTLCSLRIMSCDECRDPVEIVFGARGKA
jgi:hypothetical protein